MVYRTTLASSEGKVEETLSSTLTDKVAIYAAVGVLISLGLLSSTISDVPEAPLWARVAPNVIGQGLWAYMWWVGYKNDFVSRNTLAFVIILGIVSSSHNIGHSWFDYDVSSRNGVQSMFMAGGTCLERKILRTGSNGYLLYSPALLRHLNSVQKTRSGSFFKTNAVADTDQTNNPPASQQSYPARLP